ncbi:MAG: MotA/TolQ/ExbB proton channel family protein [Methylohalobius sp.]|nr:MotA/TolQ/ExbB proton channel family protein [Methylohalobius sp.]
MNFNTRALLFIGLISAQVVGAQPPSDPSAKPQESNPKPTDLAPSESLESVYRREYAFLDTQRRQLRKLLEDFQNSAQGQQKQLENKVAALQQQILNLSLTAKRLEEAIAEAEKQSESAQENASLLDTTLTQAKASLEDYGLTVEERPSPPEQLSHLFQQALHALKLGSTAYLRQGVFFLPDGREVQGTLFFLGNVAAYGVSPQAAGILLPAGEGRLKLIENPKGTDTAQALVAAQTPSALPVFLFENLKQAVQLEQKRNWRQELDAGGPIAWIIAGLGVLGLLLAAVRIAILLHAGWGGKRLTKHIVSQVGNSGLEAAQEQLRQTKGAYAPVLHASLSHVQATQEEWEIAVSDTLLQQTVHLDRFASLILVIAAVAPLLGLLGTVTGMIETFDVITRFGTGDPKLLATGIAIALITTEVGLIVAIPLLLIGNLLNGWASSLKTDLELSALAVREAAHNPSLSWNMREAQPYAVVAGG